MRFEIRDLRLDIRDYKFEIDLRFEIRDFRYIGTSDLRFETTDLRFDI